MLDPIKMMSFMDERKLRRSANDVSIELNRQMLKNQKISGELEFITEGTKAYKASVDAGVIAKPKTENTPEMSYGDFMKDLRRRIDG